MHEGVTVDIANIINFATVALLLYKAHRSSKHTFRFTCNRHVQRGILGEREQNIRQRCIPQISLLPCLISPWHYVYSSNNDQSMITLTRFTNEAFIYILLILAPVLMRTHILLMKMGFLSESSKRWGDVVPYSRRIA
jgi:hypothetical protein